MTLTVELHGIELHGYHGVEESERRDGQLFLFDIWLDVSEEAARSDRIEDAVDYREAAAVVRDVSDGTTFHLLEALAAAVAEALVERLELERVRVRVRKPHVRLAEPVEYSAVTLERERPSSRG